MSYGTGMMIQGLSAGLRDVRREMEHDEDRAYQKEDREYQRKARELDLEGKQVGLQDTRDRMARQKVTQKREDEEYEFKKEQAEFARDFDESMRRFAMSQGQDYQGIVDLYNNRWPDDGQVMAKRNKDGTYDVSFEKDGQTQAHKGLSFDDFGTLAMQMRDPGKWLEDKKASAAKAAERAHELTKLKVEYNLKGQLEAFKAGIDPEKAGKVPQYQKELAAMAARSYGSMNGDMMSLDENTRQSAGYVAFLATKFYDRGGGKGDINEAHLRAMQTVDRLVKVAEQQAQQSGGDFDKILDELITTEAASSMRDAPQPTSAPSLDVFVKKFLEVNKGATEADAKAFYEQKYGQGTGEAPASSQQKPAAGLQPPKAGPKTAPAVPESTARPSTNPNIDREIESIQAAMKAIGESVKKSGKVTPDLQQQLQRLSARQDELLAQKGR